MTIVNDGLPEAVYQMLTKKNYSIGDADISVTTLKDSPRIRVLKNRHYKEIVVNASTLLAASLGTAFHKAIEDATKSGHSERRLSIEVNGWKISGGMDHFENGTLTDYKTLNVFKTVYCTKGVIEEFEEQLNIYAHILRENGEEVKKLVIFALFKDWNRRDFRSYNKNNKIWIPNEKSGYPEKHFQTFELNLWEPKRAKEYVEARVKLHQDAEKELPLCTSEETWRGVRCREYCDVLPFCEVGQKLLKTGILE